MDRLKNVLNMQVGDYLLYDFAWAALIFFGLLIAFWLVRKILLSRLKRFSERTDSVLDDHAVDILDNISVLFYLVVALYFALQPFTFDPQITKILDTLFLLVLVWQVIRTVIQLVEYSLLFVNTKKAKGARFSQTMMSGIRFVLTLLLWTVGVLLVLSNVGFNITSLVASLGIGGIAVALAVQNILGDIFASFSIYFDRPFDIGDFIVVGDTRGSVKKIGLKTTRIDSLDGEEIIVSNKELTSSRIQNYGRMKERRLVINLGLVYGLKSEKLKKVPSIVEKAIANIELADFKRCHFIDFGESSLNFEFVFHVLSPDYNIAMDVKQQVLLDIKSEFEKAKIEMAFPTRTVYMKKG